jgi:ABC-type multidrug transport system fused ATPase/permease subunit
MPYSEAQYIGLQDSVRQLITNIASREPEVYVRSRALGEMSFEPAKLDFEAVIEASKQLLANPLNKLPMALLRRLESAYGGITALLGTIQSYQIQVQGVDGRNALLQKIESDVGAFFDLIAPVQGFLTAIRISEDAQSLQHAASEALEKTSRVASESEEKLSAINELLRLSRDAVQKVGASRHALFFKNEAEEHEKGASRWLIATLLMTALTVILGGVNLYFAFTAPGTWSAAQSVQLIVAKFILFSLLLSAVVWCGRSYRAQRHNYVVNRHRQNALSSFEAFAEASQDDQTKNAVLLQATQSIFAPQSSGYADQAGDVQSAPQLIELIRTVGAVGK